METDEEEEEEGISLPPTTSIGQRQLGQRIYEALVVSFVSLAIRN